jgi:Skp family chaperone for outer membrane proteins
MRSILKFLLFFFCAAFCFNPVLARAELSIAVVDIQNLMTESLAAKSIQKKVQARREALQAEFSGYEKTLRDNEKQLVDKRAEMTSEDFNKKRDEFQRKLQETGGVVQKKRVELERSVSKATTILRDKILKIVSDMSEAKKYNLVLSRQNIVIVEKTMDITQDVMKTLNDQVQDIPLEGAS